MKRRYSVWPSVMEGKLIQNWRMEMREDMLRERGRMREEGREEEKYLISHCWLE